MKNEFVFTEYNLIVGDNGEIRALKSGKILKHQTDNYGYLRVYTVLPNGKRKGMFVHRLVAEAFLPNPENLAEVNHKDFNKSNNCPNNLEWCSRKQNMKHARDANRLKGHPKKELSHKRYQCIRKLYLTGSYTHTDLAEIFNMSQANVSQIISAKDGQSLRQYRQGRSQEIIRHRQQS